MGSYTYGEEESQCSDTVQEQLNSEDYLVPIREANYGLFSEINGAWFVEDGDRFAYCGTYRLLHDGHSSVTGKIQLAEMKGTDALAQAVNRYHEELYESQKAQMQVFQEEAAAMDAEEVRNNFGKPMPISSLWRRFGGAISLPWWIWIMWGIRATGLRCRLPLI